MRARRDPRYRRFTMAPRKPVPSFDLEGALANVALPAAEPVEAGFFHRTLARWLGMPEGTPRKGDAKGDAKDDAKDDDGGPVLWSYSFWKAELAEVSRDGARQTWEAHVYRAPDGPPAQYRYWIELAGAARIKRSGWLSDAPDLLAESAAFDVAPVDPKAVARVFDSDDD